MPVFYAWMSTQAESTAVPIEADSAEQAAELRLKRYNDFEGGDATLRHGSKRIVNVGKSGEQKSKFVSIIVDVIETVQFVARKAGE